MKVHRLSEQGLSAFIEKIKEAKALKKKEEQEKIFNDMQQMALEKAYIHPFPEKKSFTIDPQKEFTSRWELAVYLDSVFGETFIPPSVYNWLTLVYFSQFVKEKKQKYDIGQASNYFVKNKNHRHILSYSHFVYKRFGELVKPLFLDNSCRVIGDFTDQVFSFELGRNNPNLYRLLNRLYLNTETKEGEVKKTPRSNISGPLPVEKPTKKSKKYKEKIGNIRALKRFLVQLRETHNLDLIDEDELYNLLPKNFDHYKKERTVISPANPQPSKNPPVKKTK